MFSLETGGSLMKTETEWVTQSLKELWTIGRCHVEAGTEPEFPWTTAAPTHSRPDHRTHALKETRTTRKPADHESKWHTMQVSEHVIRHDRTRRHPGETLWWTERSQIRLRSCSGKRSIDSDPHSQLRSISDGNALIRHSLLREACKKCSTFILFFSSHLKHS